MNESMDRVLADWLHEGPESGPREGLERSLAATRRVGQRPGWTLPERWIPMELTMPRTHMQRPFLAIVMLALLTVAVVAAALLVGARPQQPQPLFQNGVIGLAKDGDIFVADRPGGDLRPLVAGPEDDTAPLFSPDGTRLAFVRQTSLGSALMLADADGTNVVQIMPEGLGWLSFGWLSFAPDGRSLMGVAGIEPAEKRVVIVPVDPGATPTVLDIPLPGSSMEISWSGGPKFNPTNPQEILVAAQPEPRGPHGLYVYDLETGGIRTIVEPAEDQGVNDVAWLPDGEHITYNGHIVAMDGSGDRALDALQAASSSRSDRLSPFSNDGTRIVAHGDDASVVVPIDREGERVELACGLGTKIACPWSWIWSPDDSMLLGDTSLLADPATGHVDELGWVREIQGTPAWQRLAP